MSVQCEVKLNGTDQMDMWGYVEQKKM